MQIPHRPYVLLAGQDGRDGRTPQRRAGVGPHVSGPRGNLPLCVVMPGRACSTVIEFRHLRVVGAWRETCW